MWDQPRPIGVRYREIAPSAEGGKRVLLFQGGSMIAVDTIAVENEVADNIYQRSELDYLIYNDPLGYADLVLNGDPEAYPEAYLKTVTEYKHLD